MISQWRSSGLRWRPPRSDWLSSPLSPDVYDMKQRWHKDYGRLGRRYETKTPEGPCVTEDYGPWELGHRNELREYIDSLRGPRNLANRAIPIHDFGPSSDEQKRANDMAIDVDDFLSRLSGPQPPSGGAGNSSGGAPGASASAEADDEDDESEELRPRYTAAEKGKQREGEPVTPSTKGPSALKSAVADSPQSLTSAMPTQGLRVPPRPHSPGNEKYDDIPSFEHIEHAESPSEAMARSLPKAREAIARFAAGNRLVQARLAHGFAPQLPLDGLGVIFDRTSRPRQPSERGKYPSSSAMERTLSQMGAPKPSSQAGSVMMERKQSRARVPDPDSEEYVDVVAESNRRLEDLSPYSPEVKVPDTPMPDLETEADGRQPPPSPLLPPSKSEDHSEGNLPRLDSPSNPNPEDARISPAKRNASEISGGCAPGPSSHRQAPRPAAPSAKIATMSVNGQERRVS